MAELTSYERVMRVLRREEPDRVPHFEWMIDRRVRHALCPDCKTMDEFAVRMGLDAILVGPDFHKEQVAPNRWRDEWAIVREDTGEENTYPVVGPIKTLDDLEHYRPPDPYASGRYTSLERTVREFKGKKAIGVHLNDVFSLPRYLTDMETILVSFVTEPELVRGLVELSVDINLKMAKEVAARGADFVWTGDDYAHKRGPMMSPRHFREFLYPGLCRVVAGFHEVGLPIIKHTDGNLWSIIDMIVDSGIDCLDPIDPSAGMELGEVKAKYGDRVALKGNVDCAQTMTFGTPEDVIAETREALRKGMPGGGYILSSSNSIHSAVKPENYLAMLRTLQEYGHYPVL
ncbi:MAG TPA: hypothetical protein DEP84_24050 [Chloroflexi bacterium]|nr:hypothetical protein [Chloroflexota bacterium]